MRKLLILVSLSFCLSHVLSGQCYVNTRIGPPWNGLNPAFSFQIPNGVTVTSVKVVIKNYLHGGGHFAVRIRSFKDLQTLRIFESGEYELLKFPIGGHVFQDLQIESGMDGSCWLIGDFVKFEWEVRIEATGLAGTPIDYSGELTDNLANPTSVGTVYNGTNRVSGAMDFFREGSGVVQYIDFDNDGFGDPSQPTAPVCGGGCSGAVTNNLDCDDLNSSINPGKKEIPYNGKDDDCDPSTSDDDLDKDGFLKSVDCNDSDPGINPTQEDIPENGIDENCNGSDAIITSTEKHLTEGIGIYPNPASDFIYVKSEDRSQLKTELWNPAGQKILTSDGEAIAVSEVAPGIYFLKIRAGISKTIVRKIVISREK